MWFFISGIRAKCRLKFVLLKYPLSLEIPKKYSHVLCVKSFQLLQMMHRYTRKISFEKQLRRKNQTSFLKGYQVTNKLYKRHK
jgi:hypothetical protein